MTRATILVALALGLAGCLAPAEMLQERMLPDTAPTFTAYTHTGDAWELAGHQGKTILLDVMAVECSACVLQTPALREVAHRHAGGDFAMISIEMGAAFPGWGAEDDDELVRFHTEHNLTWPIASDPDGTVFRDYKVLVLPTLVVIRPDGTIHRTLLGDRSADEISRAIREAGQGG